MPRHHMKGSPPTCSCSSSPFNYSPAGHVFTADINIVNNDDLKSLIVKVQYKDTRSFNFQLAV